MLKHLKRPKLKIGQPQKNYGVKVKVDLIEKEESQFDGLTGGQIFHCLMKKYNIKHIFGYPGGAILPVFDAIYKSNQFDLIVPRHEQGAGHMAEGYARASGKPGVVLVTSGPGATNVITPMQDALSDGVPLVVFCGQVPTTAIGTDAFQEADMVGISTPCTKWNVMIKDICDLPRRIDEAFHIATSGRPGPVLVDLPKDVTANVFYNNFKQNNIFKRAKISDKLYNRLYAIQDTHLALDKVAHLINMAKKPLIYAGHGVIWSKDAPELLKQLSELSDIPVTTTLQGLGCFNEYSERSLHMLGMHGSAYANLAVQECDLLISLGARFDDRVTGSLSTFARNARIAEKENRGGVVQFEISAKNVGKTVPVTVAVIGDVGHNLKDLLPLIRKIKRPDWLFQLNKWKIMYPFSWLDSSNGKDKNILKPQQVLEELNIQLQAPNFRDKVIITTGVGQHQMFAAQYIRWTKSRTFITSGGLGTMGFGLPSAIGAQIACPDHIVIDIDGDASFSMTAMELATAAQFKIPVKVLILNNQFQGMVKQWQDLFYEERYSATEMYNPDFVKLANAMKVTAFQCSEIKELPEAISWFLKYKDGPILLDVQVSKHQNVYPMVPAGKALHEMVLNENLDQVDLSLHN